MVNLDEILKKIKLPFFNTLEVYFDLGTSVTKIAIKNKGLILREPTYLGYHTRLKNYVFFGSEAKAILGKTPDFIKVVRPIINGVISDFDAQVALLNNFLERSAHLYSANKIIKPVVNGIAITPITATEIEQKAVEESLIKAGLSQVLLIEKPLATATGCQIDVFKHEPHLIVELGGGLNELSIVGSGGIISYKTLKNAGDYMNKLIYNYIYLKYGLILGESTCEDLKINLMGFTNEDKTVAVRGKSLESGLPKSIRVKNSDIKEALLSNFNLVVDSIKEMIESAPPEIVDEIMKRGIIITGGVSKIKGIAGFFENEIKIKVVVSPQYEYSTIYGLMNLATNEDKLSRLIVS